MFRNVWRLATAETVNEPRERRGLGGLKRYSPNPQLTQVRQGCYTTTDPTRNRFADIRTRQKFQRRLFWVRPSLRQDHPALEEDAVPVEESVTVVRLSDGRRWIFSRQSKSFLDLIDSDFHARERLAAGARAAFRLLGRGTS
jgi:hypothetical protein